MGAKPETTCNNYKDTITRFRKKYEIPSEYNKYNNLKTNLLKPLEDDNSYNISVYKAQVVWHKKHVKIVDKQFSQAIVHADYNRILRSSLNANDIDTISIYDCLKSFCRPETLTRDQEWSCVKCKEHKCADLCINLWNSNDIL